MTQERNIFICKLLQDFLRHADAFGMHPCLAAVAADTGLRIHAILQAHTAWKCVYTASLPHSCQLHNGHTVPRHHDFYTGYLPNCAHAPSSPYLLQVCPMARVSGPWSGA